jgi:ATP-dependent DNA helicase RecQ
MLPSRFLENKLKQYFNYDQFRPGQREIITDVLEGNNVLGILPTGSGKSICYQLPAAMLHGLTIVISPLISLMIDQVKELKARYFKQVVAVNSLVSFEERQEIFNNLAQYKLLYISPELLQKEDILTRLTKEQIDLIVVDEAHCVSKWGHDFRPDYLKLGAIIESFGDPPVLAISATATPDVQNDIIDSLKLDKVKRHIYPMDRNNLTFTVEKVMSDEEKLERITTFLENYLGPTLIYFTSRNQTEYITEILQRKMPSYRIAYYHGGMDAIDRIQVQQQFMNGQIDIICCTSAFGMGINKPDIRLIIHYHLPSQIEDYIQEVGRAGRDGKPSICLLLYGYSDVAIPKHLIENELPQAIEIERVLSTLKQWSEQEISVPLDKDDLLVESLQISESKWRFLRFHLEKHGMIKGKEIIYQASYWQSVYHHLVKWVDSRMIHKRKELQEMVDWIMSPNCLRKELYKKFQTGYRTPIFQCCSNCGVDLNEWMVEHKLDHLEEELDWRSKLQRILLG